MIIIIIIIIIINNYCYCYYFLIIIICFNKKHIQLYLQDKSCREQSLGSTTIVK